MKQAGARCPKGHGWNMDGKRTSFSEMLFPCFGGGGTLFSSSPAVSTWCSGVGSSVACHIPVEKLDGTPTDLPAGVLFGLARYPRCSWAQLHLPPNSDMTCRPLSKRKMDLHSFYQNVAWPEIAMPQTHHPWSRNPNPTKENTTHQHRSAGLLVKCSFSRSPSYPT